MSTLLTLVYEDRAAGHALKVSNLRVHQASSRKLTLFWRSSHSQRSPSCYCQPPPPSTNSKAIRQEGTAFDAVTGIFHFGERLGSVFRRASRHRHSYHQRSSRRREPACRRDRTLREVDTVSSTPLLPTRSTYQGGREACRSCPIRRERRCRPRFPRDTPAGRPSGRHAPSQAGWVWAPRVEWSCSHVTRVGEGEFEHRYGTYVPLAGVF